MKRPLSRSKDPAAAKAASCMLPSHHMVAERSKGRLARNRVGCIVPRFLFYQPREAGSEEGLEDFCVYSGCMRTFQCTGEECEAGGFTSHA
jgi:hypothetical protein